MADDFVVPLDNGVEEFCAGYACGYNRALSDVELYLQKGRIYKGVITTEMFQGFREYQRDKEMK